MNKFKTLLLPVLGACALTAQAQDSPETIINRFSAGEGDAIMVCYSASFQEDRGMYHIDPNDDHSDRVQTTNMWIKDVFGGAKFKVLPGKDNAVMVENAFGGLLDWEIDLSDKVYVYNQDENRVFESKDGKYDIRFYPVCFNESGLAFSSTPTVASGIYPEYAETFGLWSNHDDFWNETSSNINSLGMATFPHNNYDYSSYLSIEYGTRFKAICMEITEKANPQNVTKNYYSCILFKHYFNNTQVTDVKNGETRTFHAIADATGNGEFTIYNFSDFGPCFTQPAGSGKGYGEGLIATISPISGKFLPDGTIIIERQPGYVHYDRDATAYNITKWHDCWTAGVKSYTTEDGKIVPTLLEETITGNWVGSLPHHHHEGDVTAPATNPWVTDGGTCRTEWNISINIDPYVYCTDEQLNANKYDDDDEHDRGGVYTLCSATTREDLTLQLAIENQDDEEGKGSLARSIYKYSVTKDDETKYYIACPVAFDVTSNEQYVDHYEVCAYLGSGNNPVEDASDEAYGNESSLLNTVMTPAATYIIPANERTLDGTSHYEAFKLKEQTSNKISAGITTTHPDYEKVLSIEIDNPEQNIDETLTFYVKAVYKAGTGLNDTYHSLQNVPIKVDKIVTGIDDINVKQSVASKVLENGQVFIIKNGVKYNTMGQRVK